MDFTDTDNYRNELARRRRIWPWILAGIPVLLILLIVLLPTLLSLAPVRRTVLSKVNAAMAPATLSIDRWSFAWFGHQTLDGITYTDPHSGLTAKVKQLRLNSLVKLLPLGKITADALVDTPDIALDPAAAAAYRDAHPTAPAAPAAAAAPAESEPITLPFRRLTAALAVRHARFALAPLPEPLISDLSADLDLPELGRPFALKLAGNLLDGDLTAALTLPPLPGLLNERRPGAMLSDATLALTAPWARLSFSAKGSDVLLPSAELGFDSDLTKLLARLRTLRLPVTQPEALAGTLGLSLKLTPENGTQSVRAALTSQHIAATLNGKTLRLSPKLDLRARIPNANPGATVLDRLSLELPGVLAAGQGSLKGGSLQAAVDIDALAEVLRPVIGPLPLPEKLTLRLQSDIRPEGTTDLLLEARRGTAKLLRADLHATGFNPETLSLKNGKAELTADLDGLAKLVPLPPAVKTLGGTFCLNAAGSGSPEKASVRTLFALRNADIRTDGWSVREPSLLDGSFRTDWDGRRITLTALKTRLPFGSIKGSAAYDTQMTGLFRALQLSLEARLQPGYPLKKWSDPKPGSRPLPEVDGTLSLNTTLRPADSGLLPNAYIRLSGDRLLVRDTSVAGLPKEPLTLELSGDIRPEGNSSVSLDSRRGTVSLVTAALQAVGVNPKQMSVGSGKVTVNANLTELTRLVPLPSTVHTLKGQLLFSAAGAGSKNNAALSALLALRDTDIRVDGWTVREPSLLESAFKAAWDGRRAELTEFKAKLPLGTVNASAAFDTQIKNLLQALTLSLNARLQPGYPLKKWSDPKPGAKPLPDMDGTVVLAASVTPAASGLLPNAAVDLHGENLLFRSAAIATLPKEPLSLRLKGGLRPEGTTDIRLDASRGTVPLIQATAQASGTDPQSLYIEDGKATLSADLKELAALLPLPPKIKKLQGRLRLHAAGSGSARKATLKTVFALRDTDILLDGLRIREASLAEGSFRADWAGRRLQLSDFVTTLPLGTVKANALVDTRLKPLGKALNANVDADLRPGYPLARWILPKPGAKPLPKADGTLAVALRARPSEVGQLPDLTLTAASDTLCVRGGPVPGSIPLYPLRLSLAAGDLDSGDLRLSDLSFSVPYVALTGDGTFVPATGITALNGTLTPDFTTLWKLDIFKDLRAKGIFLSGRNTRPFTFSAPVTQGTPVLLGNGKGSLQIVFDRITVPMFDIPNATAAVTLDKGLAEVRTDVAFNGGHVRLHPDIRVDTVPMRLVFNPGSKIVDNVGITQEMMNAVIDGSLPFLKGAASPHGSFDLVAERFSMNLDGNPLASLNADLTFRTHSLSLIPGGPMKALPVLQELIKKPKEYLADVTRLRLLRTVAESEDDNVVAAALDRLDIGQIRIGLPDQEMKLHFDRGNMAVDPFKFSFDGAVKALVCEGSANLLSRDLDYRLRLPLSDRFMQKYRPEHARSGELIVPVGGKIDAPKIDLSPIRATLRSVIRENAVSRATQKLHEKAGSKLDKYLKKAGLDSDSDGNGHNDAIDAAEDALDSALRSLFGN